MNAPIESTKDLNHKVPTTKDTPGFTRILNFRDVAQHINTLTSQPLLRLGLLYRSARPDAATPGDRDLLTHTYKIKTIIDLRTPTEHIEQARKLKNGPASIPTAPTRWPGAPAPPLRIPEIRYEDVNLNGSGYSNALIKQLSYTQTAKLYSLYILNYRKHAISILGTNVMAPAGLSGLAISTLQHSKNEIAALFSLLSHPETYPVLLHCTQGKDRTGLIVLLILLLCGCVPRSAIDQDYRLSEEELESERGERLEEIRSIGLPDSFAECPEGWTDAVCDFLEKEGGVEKYLEGCGVTGEQKRGVRGVLVQEGP